MHPFTAGEFLLDAVGPPIMTALWWVMSRGWALGIQRGKVSDRTRARQKREFFVLLVVLYLIGFGMSFYVHVLKK